MHNFNYEKKYHYLVKYFVIAFPLIFSLILCLVDTITAVELSNTITNISYFLEVSINQWYFNIIDLLGLKATIFDNGGILSLLLVYPLYVFWVYVFDLVLDIFVFVPKLAHKLLYKLGG